MRSTIVKGMIYKQVFRSSMLSMIALLLFLPLGKGQAQTTNTVSPTPVFALSTNLLYDATTSMNLGVELKMGKHFTFKLPVTYNPWEWKDDKKWRFLLVQPELRWWFCEPFYGSFIGLHGHGSYYNVGGIGTKAMTDYRYQGYLYGGGISYGHQFYLSPRWNLEVSVGGGYVYLNYDQYHYYTDGALVKSQQKEHHLWPTQAGITLIYIIR